MEANKHSTVTLLIATMVETLLLIISTASGTSWAAGVPPLVHFRGLRIPGTKPLSTTSPPPALLIWMVFFPTDLCIFTRGNPQAWQSSTLKFSVWNTQNIWAMTTASNCFPSGGRGRQAEPAQLNTSGVIPQLGHLRKEIRVIILQPLYFPAVELMTLTCCSSRCSRI